MKMKKNAYYFFPVMISIVCGYLWTTSVYAAKLQSGSNRYEDSNMIMRVSSRKPEQLDAFYTGRGFSRAATNEIKKACFLTVMVRNKNYEALWLVLDDWVFLDQHGNQLKRLTHLDWKNKWQLMGVKQAHKSTFGWTLLPESRDLRANEHAAGNVTLSWHDGPIKLVAAFKTGLDKMKGSRVITLENLQCTK